VAGGSRRRSPLWLCSVYLCVLYGRAFKNRKPDTTKQCHRASDHEPRITNHGSIANHDEDMLASSHCCPAPAELLLTDQLSRPAPGSPSSPRDQPQRMVRASLRPQGIYKGTSANLGHG